MNRRSFLKTSATTTAVAAGTLALPHAATAAQGDRQYLELRKFIIKSKTKQNRIIDFLGQAAIPALNRIGVKPVGVFLAPDDQEDYSVTILLPFRSLTQFGNWEETLGQDSEFTEKGAAYLGAEKSDPAFDRIESTLMLSFEAYPEVKSPRKGDRIFELRTYQSHSERKGFLKVEMFNRAELDIFQKVGLDGVFYGRSLSGPNLPNLTYMLAYKDEEEKKKAWKGFLSHPDWDELKTRERYKDTVSKITSQMLVPASCSQI